MRYIIYFVFLMCALLLSVQAQDRPAVPSPDPTPVPSQVEPNIAFDWAFGALIGKNKTMVAITKDTSLQSGEEIKLYVKLLKDCFVYVFYYGSKGELSLLFPKNVRQFQTDYQTDKDYYFPVGRAWSKLDENTGPEKFYIVASTERLLDVEAKLGNYLAADASKKKTLADDIISDIRNVRKRYSTFATLAEKPITIGGNIRGTGETVEEARRPDVSTIATKVTATNFFAKTITIDHK